MDGWPPPDSLKNEVHRTPSEWIPRERVQKTSEWRWMKPVYVRLDETEGRAKISFLGKVTCWTDLPIAILHPADCDLFEPARSPPKPSTVLPYPLRIVSMPNEPLRVADRRMVRRSPSGDTWDIIVTFRETQDATGDILIDIGGGRRIHTVRLERAHLVASMAQDARLTKAERLLQFTLRDLTIEPEPIWTLETRFDQFLMQIDEPDEWFKKHVVEHCGLIPERRMAALLADEMQVETWLRGISDATGGQDGEGEDEYDRAA